MLTGPVTILAWSFVRDDPDALDADVTRIEASRSRMEITGVRARGGRGTRSGHDWWPAIAAGCGPGVAVR
jgi:methionine synthase II (cobalamin-independent)